jgi:hypothetical protein
MGIPMAAVVSIVLNDAQATPVAHTFIPLGPDQNGAWWYEDQSVGTSPVGYNRISLQLVRAPVASPGTNAGERTARVKIGLHTPKLEALGTNDSGLTPPPTVAYTPRCNVEFILSERSILQDRKDLRKYVDFLMAEAQVTAMVETLQNVY